MTCCPLPEADEAASLWSEATRTARLRWRCCECDEVIVPGERYQHAKSLCWGGWSSHRTCLICAELVKHFACGPVNIGELWEALREHFFPDMRAGGPCMDGLSAEAKSKLVDEWRRWKGVE